MNESKGFRFIEGVVIGGIIGAAARLLLAPETGEEAREELEEKGKAMAAEAKSDVLRGMRHVEKKVEHVKRAVE